MKKMSFNSRNKTGLLKHGLLICWFALSAVARAEPLPAATPPGKTFDDLANTALAAMAKRAEELKIKGAAVVAYIDGDTVTSWSSKMLVVGKMKNDPTEKNRGSNLLAVAYTKATEMAATLQDSGNAGRPPMSGETGYKGGLIKKGKTGYLIAAFSGGPSESDLKVSQAGLEILAEKM